MMDHGLRTISYIADIGELVVIMARRRILPQDGEEPQVIGTTPKMICHVFESEEVSYQGGKKLKIRNSDYRHSSLPSLLAKHFKWRTWNF
jgi:hypothetical protein